MQLRICFLVILALVATACYSRSVVTRIRQNFPDDIVLHDAKLVSGAWGKKPAALVQGRSKNFTTVFSVKGDAAVEGYVIYKTTDGFASVEITFTNSASNNTYKANVGPAPFIGGVQNVDGDADATLDVWLHQMCNAKTDKSC